MTALLEPDAAPVAPAVDIAALEAALLAVHAELMPAEIVRRRQARAARRQVTVALALVAVLIAGWFGVTRLGVSGAAADRDAANAAVARITAQEHGFGELVATQNSAQAVEVQLATLMHLDVQWAALIGRLHTALPRGTALTGVAASVDGVATAAGALPAAQTGTVATLTLTGTAPSQSLVAAYLQRLAAVPGLANVLPVTLSSGTGTLVFTATVDVTDAALGGRFTPAKAGK